MPDLIPLAQRINEKRSKYERLAKDYWDTYQPVEAIRYRAMAEAYADALENDLTWFAQGGGRSGE